MRPAAKIGVVAAGFVAAFLAAYVFVVLYISASGRSGVESESSMQAFGDTLLFLGIFGVAGIPATAAALYFLRPVPSAWRWLSVGALVAAGTSIAAIVDDTLILSLSAWTAVGSFKLILAPLFVLAFALAAVFAPTRPSRRMLAAAAGIEAIAFLIFVGTRL